MATTISVLCDLYDEIDVLSRSEEAALALLDSMFRRGLYSEREYQAKRDVIASKLQGLDVIHEMILRKIRLEP